MPGRSAGPGGREVELVGVDEPLLAELVAVAVGNAAAAEVTPPLTPGDAWSPERVEWLRTYHRERRGGLAVGPHREATWAVVVDGAVAGAVRLRHTGLPGGGGDGGAETGMWLARSARGRGIGARALAAVVGTARSLGYAELRAETSSGNRPALAVLTAAGFVLDPPDEAGVVVARLALTAPETVAGG